MANPREQILSDPGGTASELVEMTPAPQVINITDVQRQGNPWVSPSAYRNPADDITGENLTPELMNSAYQADTSQYAPAVVSPAGTPTYTHGAVIDPTPIISVPNTGA